MKKADQEYTVRHYQREFRAEKATLKRLHDASLSELQSVLDKHTQSLNDQDETIKALTSENQELRRAAKRVIDLSGGSDFESAIADLMEVIGY